MRIIRQVSVSLAWLAVVFLSVSVTAQTVPQGTVTYIHNDLLGSPAAATNAVGVVIWREAYSGYGERLKNETEGAANRVWYTSRHQDEDTGLVYMGARYYDPSLGRFLSVDSVYFVETNIHSFNRYAYANNNPYRFKDPDGKRPISGHDEPFVYKGGQSAQGPEWSANNTEAYLIGAGVVLTPAVGNLGAAAVLAYRAWRAAQVAKKISENEFFSKATKQDEVFTGPTSVEKADGEFARNMPMTEQWRLEQQGLTRIDQVPSGAAVQPSDVAGWVISNGKAPGGGGTVVVK